MNINELVSATHLENALAKLPFIAKNLNKVYVRAKELKCGTYAAAKKMALEKIALWS